MLSAQPAQRRAASAADAAGASGESSRRQAMIWTNTAILLIWSLGTNSVKSKAKFIYYHLKQNIVCKMQQFCLGIKVLRAHWVNWGNGRNSKSKS